MRTTPKTAFFHFVTCNTRAGFGRVSARSKRNLSALRIAWSLLP